MRTATRRGTLLAALAGPALAAPAVIPSAADAELLALSANWLDLWNAVEAEPDDATADALADRRNEVRDAMLDIQPAGPAGMAALARVALRDANKLDQEPAAFTLCRAVLSAHDPVWLATYDAEEVARSAAWLVREPEREAARRAMGVSL